MIQSLVINVYQREKAIIKRQELKKPSHKMIQNRITRSDTGHHIIVLVHAWKEVLLRGFNLRSGIGQSIRLRAWFRAWFRAYLDLYTQVTTVNLHYPSGEMVINICYGVC